MAPVAGSITGDFGCVGWLVPEVLLCGAVDLGTLTWDLLGSNLDSLVNPSLLGNGGAVEGQRGLSYFPDTYNQSTSLTALSSYNLSYDYISLFLHIASTLCLSDDH
jgi:hypothetical protein